MSKKAVSNTTGGDLIAGYKEDELDRMVVAYCLKMGYKSSVKALKAESKHASALEHMSFSQLVGSNADVAGHVMMFNGQEIKAESYDIGYSATKNWIGSSLELYKHELGQMLWPLFVHCYLALIKNGFAEEGRRFMEHHSGPLKDAHNDEIKRLTGIRLPHHLDENDLAKQYRTTKFSVEMCVGSFELFISYLHDNKFMLLLSMVNQYVSIHVFAGKPIADQATLASRSAMTGDKIEEQNMMNQKKILWGLLDEHADVKLEAIDDEDVKKKRKKAKLVEGKEGGGQRKGTQAGNAPTRDRVPLPVMNEQEIALRLQVLQEMRQCVRLGPSSLPSACMYTFLNTHNDMSTISFSDDATLAATGCSDSTIRLWSLTGEPMKSMKMGDALEELENCDHITMDMLMDDASASTDKILLGHSGPVYRTGFSPCNKFLFSASEDSTVRLWSLMTHTNLVCYKGHNYPVWDLDVAPVGHYFVTGSHDRTARLWSTDYIYPLRVFCGHLSDVDVVKFHPNCNYVATGSSDKTVRLWDVAKGDCVRLLTGHQGTVYSLAISPDGKYLASAGEDKIVNLWDLSSGTKVTSFAGHEDVVYSLCFSGDTSVLASGSADNTVRIWDVKAAGGSSKSSNLQLAMLPTKSTPVSTVKFTRQNLLLAAGAFDPSRSTT
eukprot:CFRG1704T1